MKFSLKNASILSAMVASTSAMAGAEKIDLCHQTASGNIVVLTIPLTAANAHIQNHFDYIPNTFYDDTDQDNLGDPDVSFKSCDDAMLGFVLNSDDLDPLNEYQQYQDATAEDEEFEDEDSAEAADEL